MIAANDIHLWLVPRPADVSPSLLALTTPAEQHRSQGMSSARRRCEWLTGRALVRACLAHYTGMAPLALVFGQTAQGKPLLDLPDAPAFNLSHGPDWLGCAVGKASWLGLDIDSHDRRNSVEAITARYFHPAEQAWIASAAGSALLRERFFTHWTLKEAYIKALGETINSVRLRDIAFDTRCDPPQPLFPLPANHWDFRHWMLDANQHMAVACGGNGQAIPHYHFWRWDVEAGPRQMTVMRMTGG